MDADSGLHLHRCGVRCSFVELGDLHISDAPQVPLMPVVHRVLLAGPWLNGEAHRPRRRTNLGLSPDTTIYWLDDL